MTGSARLGWTPLDPTTEAEVAVEAVDDVVPGRKLWIWLQVAKAIRFLDDQSMHL